MSEIQNALIALKNHIAEEIIGQDVLVERMLIGLLADGHILVEGAPGLAKTRAINVLSHGIEGDFHRVQFTPDLLPADLTGTEIYRPQQGTFEFQKGPLFHNLILADEINRSPWGKRPINYPRYLWSWQRKTRLNKKVLIRCPKHNWIDFYCR